MLIKYLMAWKERSLLGIWSDRHRIVFLEIMADILISNWRFVLADEAEHFGSWTLLFTKFGVKIFSKLAASTTSFSAPLWVHSPFPTSDGWRDGALASQSGYSRFEFQPSWVSMFVLCLPRCCELIYCTGSSVMSKQETLSTVNIYYIFF